VIQRLAGFKTLGYPCLISAFFLLAPSLPAQNAVTVTSNDGGDGLSGSLGWAVTNLNALGAGTVTFNGAYYITLLQPLSAFVHDVTFSGPYPVIYGQDASQAQLLFQQGFQQTDSMDLINNGGLGTSLDAAITALAWSMGTTALVQVRGGMAAGFSTIGGAGAVGPDGGNASVNVGTWSTGSNVFLTGGDGASVTDSGGSNDQGGAGGSAALTVMALTLPGYGFNMSGGAGGSVTDLVGGSSAGGSGGSAYVTAGSVSIGGSTNMTLVGGLGGGGVTGGAGGGATLLAESVTVNYGLSLTAGRGGDGVTIGGNGGSAFVSFGSFIQSSSINTQILGGDGGNSSQSIAGNGGRVLMEGDSLSLNNLSGLIVQGGNGGTDAGLGGSVAGGNGGDAGVSLGSFYDAASGSSGAYVTIAGGNGGAGSSGSAPGAGGKGGNADLTLANFSFNTANNIILSGGAGGAGGDNTGSGPGGTGGDAGDLTIALGSLSLGTGSSLTFTGNAGGSGGASASGIGGAGGGGGNVYFSAGSVTLGTGSSMDLAGGLGGAGGTGATNGTDGAQGQVTAMALSLANQGNLFLDSNNAILLVGSGGFTQSAGATLRLVLDGTGASSSGFVNVSGVASLNGELVLSPGLALTAPARGTSLSVLFASSISGTFRNVGETLPGMRFYNYYDSTAVSLLSINPSFRDSGLTPNQKAMGIDLDTFVFDPVLAGVVTQLGVLSDTHLQTAENHISPEDLASIYQAGFEAALSHADLVEERLGRLMDDVDNGFWMPGFSDSGSPWFASDLPGAQEVALAPKKNGSWGGFISGNGGFFNVASDSNAAGYKVTTFGLEGAGADYRLSHEMGVGVLAGYGHTDVTLGTGGTLSGNGGELGLYGLYYKDGFYGTALVEGGINSYSSQRLSFGGTATGTTQGTQYDGALEAGYAYKKDKAAIGPFGSIQYAHVGIDGFTEQGSSTPLVLASQGQDSVLCQAGLKSSGYIKMGNATLVPAIRLGWEHEFSYRGGAIRAAFGQGDSFTVQGPKVGQDGIRVGATLSMDFSKEISASLGYQGELARTNLDSHQVGAGVGLKF